MTVANRPPRIHHSTSEPFRFFGRAAELTLLDEAFRGGPVSLIVFVGPGGQGKTAILQEWLGGLLAGPPHVDGVFLWSFYRGKDSDLCLRELYAYAAGLSALPDVSASYCVDHLLPMIRHECWVLLLDGVEVVQHESGPWFGRAIHPELGRLLDELAGAPMPGVVVVTTRFPLPGMERRRHARLVSLGGLDADSAQGLLASLGVRGTADELEQAAASCGHHAKAVELLATYLVRFRNGKAIEYGTLPPPTVLEGYSEEEYHVARVLAAFQGDLSQESQDILALAAAFRDPPPQNQLVAYLRSLPVHDLLHHRWLRAYEPFAERQPAWLAGRIDDLVALRLLERVGRAGGIYAAEERVIDAHPLVRRGFEHVLGEPGRRQSAQARAGFLRGRPDRRRAENLEQAREEVELFHAFCDAHLWNEADGVLVALDNPKHRFLAPAFERDLLLRFFPDGDWRGPPLWSGFGRYRSLAICFELLGQFSDALAAYPGADRALCGDALLALGRVGPLLEQETAAAPWQVLWQAYRAHALCLAGQPAAGLALARSLVPVDIYEWVHVFECLLRAGRLEMLDLRSMLFRPPGAREHRWADLARQRMQADYVRLTGPQSPDHIGAAYAALTDAYDRGGLVYERALVRLGYTRWLLTRGQAAAAQAINAVTRDLAGRHDMVVVGADAWEIETEICRRQMDRRGEETAGDHAARLRAKAEYNGPSRP
jgi:hypothetical protein